VEKTVADLADLVGGRVVGDPTAVVRGLAAAGDAGPRDVTFADGPEYVALLRARTPGAVFVRETAPDLACPQVVVAEPRVAFFTVAALLAQFERPAPGVSDRACVDPAAEVSPEATVMPLAYVGPRARIGARTVVEPGAYVAEGAVVGADCIVGAGVRLGTRVRIGGRVVLHFGAAVGADGFGFLPRGDVHVKVPQLGGVVVEDDVEIGANSTIDRGTLGDTVIGAGTKIDNLVHVAHNCRVGRGCLLVAFAGLAGSTVLGDGVMIGPRAGTKDHVTVGAGSKVGGMSGVHKDLPAGATVMGYPAQDHLEWKRGLARVAGLGDAMRRLRALEKRVREMEETRGPGTKKA
jgi:UDP-3-O-[3-hydroxymyristoyl] glucosamine N-acyltransferase